MLTVKFIDPLQSPGKIRHSAFFAYDGGATAIDTNFFSCGGNKSKEKEGDFSNVVGKRILCKAQGLSGAEKNLCEKQILAKCGRKPFCPPIFGSAKCFKRRLDWGDCAKAQAVESAGTISDTGGAGSIGGDDNSVGGGAGTGEKTAGTPSWVLPVAIGAAILLVVGVSAALISSARKSNISQVKTVPLASNAPKIQAIPVAK